MEEKVLETKSFVNNDGTDNHVGESDELAIEMLQNQKTNYEQELEAYEENVKQIQKDIDNFKVQWDIDKELYQIQLDNFGVKDEHKTHLAHDLPRFWELQKKKFEFQVREDTFRSERVLEGKEFEMSKAKERIATIKEQLAEVNKKLGEHNV